MPEADSAVVMDETAVANGGTSTGVADSDKKDNIKKEEVGENNDLAVVNTNDEEHNKASENGTKIPSDEDAKMTEAEDANKDDVGAAKQACVEDVISGGVDNVDTKEGNDAKAAEHGDSKTGGVGDADAKEDDNATAAEHEDSKTGVVADADAKEDENAKAAQHEYLETGDAAVKDEGLKEDKEEKTEDKKELKDTEQGGSDKHDELNEQGKDGLAEQEEKKAEEMSDGDGQGEEDAEKGSSDKKDGGDGKTNANEEKIEKQGGKKRGKGDKVAEEVVSDADKSVDENKEETPKNKKARSARDRSQGKDKKQDGSKSREAKSLLNTPTPYGTDRPQRERKIVERLVEVIEKEPNRNFVVEKGRGTPLKDIPSVAQRLSRKKPTDLKFLHNVLFGRKGKTVDFKGHILQFSGFVWHESDEKQRAKAKEKLDRCMKDMLVELCSLLAIPVPKTNIRKEDIVAKLLDFIAEPHAMSDSGLSDDLGSNSRKRKRGGHSSNKTPDVTPKRSKKKFADDTSPSKRRKQALEYGSDEEMEDEYQPMKSDSEEDADETPDEQEDGYDSVEEEASMRSSEIKDSAGKKKAAAGSTHKTGLPMTTSKSAVKTSPSKVSKEKESPDESAKVFSRKKKPVISKRTPSSEKEIEEKKSSGKEATKGKGESAEGGLPSKAELKKTIIGILKKVDFNTSTFSDILKKLVDHYKIDLAPRKGAIKIMIQEELTKLSEEADNDEDENEDVEKKQPRRQAKVTA
ncbi:unnamed protein product [Alopecurus aequalis]